MPTIKGEFEVCGVCGNPRLTAGCAYCRAIEAEAKLVRLSEFGEDDWMRRLALAEVSAGQGRRLRPLGFCKALPTGMNMAMVTATSRPQTIMKPELLTVAPECAAYGMLVSLEIGNKSQLVDNTPIPLSLFSPANWASIEIMREAMSRFAFDTISVVQDVKFLLDFTMSAEPLVQEAHAALGGAPFPTAFKAALWGATAEDFDTTITLPSVPYPYGLSSAAPLAMSIPHTFERGERQAREAAEAARSRETIKRLAQAANRKLDPKPR